VRDYRAASGGDPSRLGTASPFNIKLESLRVGDFVQDEVRALYAQHSRETGQAFSREALQRAWDLAQGQPWLTNALAREIIEKMHVAAPEPITAEHIEEAKERLIVARATHLDSLVAKLGEARVRRVIEPLLEGSLEVRRDAAYDDDLRYVRDLGLLATNDPIRIANPVYREVIPRVLAGSVEGWIEVEPRSFVQRDGRLDVKRLLDEFASFWMLHGDVISGGMDYHEVAPHLVLMAFLHRVVNSGGQVDREYGVGRGRIDLLVRWPWRDASGKRDEQREALELKVWKQGRPDPKAQGLVQIDAYLARLGLDAGVLVLFHRRQDALPIEERTRFESARTGSGREISVLRA
jgi:hypothetical protein